MATDKIQENASTEYRDYTKEASTQFRTLALAAVAIVWLIGKASAPDDTYPEIFSSVTDQRLLFYAAVAAVVGLTFDLLQYWVASAMWGRYRSVLATIFESDSYEPANFEGQVKRAWHSFAGDQITDKILEYGSGMPNVANSGTVPTDVDDRIALARRILLEMRHNPDPSVLQQKSITDNLMGEPASPLYVQRIPGTLFHLKGLAVTVSYCLILITLIFMS
ncbi:hypothetical protein H7J71_12730 [Mycolicibacterium peregrinum]|uniref:hypothetical protein n=1 Tax=Mycolicibacterium peregrinum TaxID=43304 RepID=UPI000AC15247|nr:hypothetical protein [Mycolicibacterium peregrinum]MCV7202871.1 hypothetical protein [Mycolicibacterium peregrinum]